ncbi:MAG: hypothetical protein OXH68_15365 [Gammaproteobacteria bacterium]|nr:hypothetical protein [Gammaproteobacteria bacterium]
MPDQDTAQHGDTDQPVFTSNVDAFDSPEWQSGLLAAMDKGMSRGASPGEDTAADADEDGNDDPGATDEYSASDFEVDPNEVPHPLVDVIPEDEAGEDDDGVDDADAGEDDDGWDDEEGVDAAGEDNDDEGEDDDEGHDGVVAELTREQRREIRKDPKLRSHLAAIDKAARKQRAELDDRTREVEGREASQDRFFRDVNDPEKAAAYMGEIMRINPVAGGKAFETVLTNTEQMDALIEIGLNQPKLLDRVNERLELLRSDKDARRNHDGRIKLTLEKQQLQADKMHAANRRAHRERARLEGLLTRQMRNRIPKEFKNDVLADFDAIVKKKVQDDGSVDLGEKDLKALVARHVRHIEYLDKRYRRAQGRQKIKNGQAATKRKATKNKARRTKSAPHTQGTRRPQPGRGGRKKPSRPLTPHELEKQVQNELLSHLGT